MSHSRRRVFLALHALATAAALLAAMSAPSFAQPADAASPSPDRGRIRFVADPPPGALSIAEPGGTPARRAEWLALVCDPAGCALRDAVLVSKPDDRGGCRGGPSRRSPPPTAQRIVLAVDATTAALRTGPVRTMVADTANLPVGAGVSIDDPTGPLILRTFVARTVDTDDRAAPPQVSRQIELVRGDRRQVLGALGLPTDAGAIGPPPDGVLRWAGDLDRDGRADLLLAMDADATVFMLFLSSLATPDEFVGAAGVHVRPRR